jgi:hypothetical protein
MRRLLPAAAVLAALVLPAAAQAAASTGPRQDTASRGRVTATLDYRLVAPYEARDVRLTVVRDGETVLDGDRVEEGCRGCRGAVPVGGLEGSRASSLTLRDLDGDGAMDVLVDLYTGGAHCCAVTALYRWDAAAARYRRLVHVWGDPGYRLVDAGHDGRLEFLSADDRFAYAFCAYVCSVMPVQVWRLEDGRLADVTREFPDLVRRDLKRVRRSLRRARTHDASGYALKGVLPALCADQYLLHRGSACRRALETALRRGELDRSALDLAPGGRKYVRAVLRFLRKTGYRR